MHRHVREHPPPNTAHFATKRRTEIVGALGRIRVLQIGVERRVVEDDVDRGVTANANADANEREWRHNERVKNFEQLKKMSEKTKVIEGKIAMREIQLILAFYF
jgi:hypothetical protein